MIAATQCFSVSTEDKEVNLVQEIQQEARARNTQLHTEHHP